MTCNKSTSIFLLGLASSMKTDIRTSNVDQQQLMTFAYAFSVTLMVTFALLSNILSLDTFRQVQLRSTSVGFYLIAYSCCSMFGIVMLECRLVQLLDSLSYIPFFIICNVVSGLASIFTRICLWLNGLIALQRSLHSFEGNRVLNKFRSRNAAPKQILLVITIVFAMHIHELISRVTLPDPVAQGKFVCQIKYSTQLLKLNTAFTFVHLFIPFSLNILANCLILTTISRRRATLHQTTYWSQWMKHFHRHSHLFLSPTLAIVCTLPQISLALAFSCVDVTVKWLLRLNTAANLIVYLPQSATFLLFILPSHVYLEIFRTQSRLCKMLCHFGRWNQRVVPLSTTHDGTQMNTWRKNPVATVHLHQATQKHRDNEKLESI